MLATRESELRPHAERGFAIPVSRREITSSSRLPPSRSRGAFRRSRGSGRTALEGWRISIARILRPYSRGFLHSTTSLGTLLDRASPSTSLRDGLARPREWSCEVSRGVENEPLALIRPPSHGLAGRR